MPIDISLVIPTYNSAANLGELYERIAMTCQTQLKMSFETIWVDDHSTDNTWQVLCNLQAQYPQQVAIVRLSKNFGQHNATLCGIRQAQGNILVTIDDDLQMLPENIKELYQKYQETECDLVYAVFNNEQQGKIRQIARNIFAIVQRWEGINKGKGSSFRLMNRKLYQKLINNTHGFVFIDEICLWHTQMIEFVELKLYPSKRINQKSTYNMATLVGLSVNLIIFSSNLPLRIMTLTGFSASFISFLAILFLLYKKIFKNVLIGYTSIMISIFFSTGIILFCLGIVGEYLNKLYRIQKNMPIYSIDKIKSELWVKIYAHLN